MDEHKHTEHTHTDHTLEVPKPIDPHAGHDHSGHHMAPSQPVAAEPQSEKHAAHAHTEAHEPQLKQAAPQSHEQHEQHMAHGPAGHGATGHAGHHEQMVADYRKRFWIVLLLTIPVTLLSPMIMMLFGYHFEFPGANFIVFGLSSVIFFYGGKPFLEGAWEEWKNRSLGMMMLISLAIVSAYIYSSFTAFFIEGSDFYFELATLILIMLLGHWIEMKSQMGASKALEELIKLMPKVAHRLDAAGNIEEVSIEALVPGERILVKPGEKIPLDGKIYEGLSTVDESMLTGESVPVEKQPGMQAIGGSINGSGVLKLIVEKVGNETYLAQVINMVQAAQQQKSKSQGLADKAAGWLFYIAVIAGALTFLYWIFAADLSFALERMVTVLVIACPHALGLAVPLVNAVSTSLASRNGLLIRNRTQFEEARNVDRIVFDKTGTLTEGNFGVTDILPAAGVSEKELLTLAYSAESQSEHPIAKGIVRKGEAESIALLPVTDYQNLTGQGLQVTVDGMQVAVVSPGTMDERGIAYDKEPFEKLAQQGKTVVFVLKEGILQGMIASADIIRSSSREVVAALKEQGIESIMLTGDNSRAAHYVGGKLGLAQVFAEVLPAEKSKHIASLKAGNKSRDGR